MANIIVTVPDGDYCTDNIRLDCVFSEHSPGFHWCHLFREALSPQEEIRVSGERRRAIRKCKACSQSMVLDAGDGLVVDESSASIRRDK